MNETEHMLETLKTILSPLKVEIFSFLTSSISINTIDQYKVTASTGKYSASMTVTFALLSSVENLEEITDTIKKQLNYELEHTMMKEQLKNVSNNFILNTDMDKDKIFTIVHPEKYRDLLREFGSEFHNITRRNEYVDWQKIIEEGLENGQ